MGNFHAFLSSADFFSKSTFLKNSFRNTMRVSNSLGPDQTRHSVWSDLVPNCLQKLSADDTSRQRVNIKFLSRFQTLDFVISNSNSEGSGEPVKIGAHTPLSLHCEHI